MARSLIVRLMNDLASSEVHPHMPIFWRGLGQLIAQLFPFPCLDNRLLHTKPAP